MRERACWDRTWMNVAYSLADDRSPDETKQVCAIVVAADNTKMLGLGYNGGVAGQSNERESVEPGKSGFLHAEINCLLKTPYHFIMKKIMYVTLSPCIECSRAIANSNISKVVYDEEYRDTSGLLVLRTAGVEVIKLSDVV